MRKCWLLRLKLTKNRRLQFLHAVSHSVGAHTESLQLHDDNSSEDEASQAPVPAVTTSTALESSAASTSDDCCEVCLVATRAGFALVPCRHARFCELCAMRVSEMAAGCPVCRTDNTMVVRIFLDYANPPCRYSNIETSLAMSTPAIWCRVVRSRDVHPCYMVSRPVSRCQSPQF